MPFGPLHMNSRLGFCWHTLVDKHFFWLGKLFRFLNLVIIWETTGDESKVIWKLWVKHFASDTQVGFIWSRIFQTDDDIPLILLAKIHRQPKCLLRSSLLSHHDDACLQRSTGKIIIFLIPPSSQEKNLWFISALSVDIEMGAGERAPSTDNDFRYSLGLKPFFRIQYLLFIFSF